MARIFSWYIQDDSKECFSYLAQSDSSGNYSTGYMVLDSKIESSETLKKIANVVSGYTELEYQTQFNDMKTKVAEKGLKPFWKDYTYYYDVNGNNLIMLTGNGEIGPQGPQGIQGEKGETGSAGNGRNVMCYCSLPEGYKPTRANLAGGKFYPNKWDITYPTDPVGIIVEGVKKYCSWGDSNEPVDPTYKVWMTNADFPSSTGDSPSEAVTPVVKIDSHGQKYTWATPIQISGPKGDNGADGERIEFVYKRCHKRTDPVPDRPTGTTEEQAKKQGWEDHPLGVIGDSDNPNENWRVEYMCQHIKDEKGNWGEFSDPILWASWGEDGNDGDGIEYIFAVTKDLSQESLNAIKSVLPSTTSNGGELAQYWQEPEIWDTIEASPTFKAHYSKITSVFSGWTDDPTDVSPEEPYEWVSIRRRKWNASQDKGVFGEFGTPKLWAHWGKDGEKGNDGTSVDIRDQSDTLGHLLKKLSNNIPQVGFSYAVGVDGKRVYVWMEQDSSYQIGRSPYNPPMSSEWYEKTDEDIYKNWYYPKDDKKYWFTDCGSFYGEPGKNAYVHIKYATDYTGQTGVNHVVTEIKGVNGKRDICFTTGGTTLGETPGPYIATYSDDIYDDRGDLLFYNGKWAKFEGEDGQSYGQEQIFFRSSSLLDTRSFSKQATTKEHGYDVGEWYLDIDYVGSFDKVDWVPKNWTDVPMGIVNGVYNFEYVSVRRLLEDGTWSYFSEPALYNEAGDTTDFQVEYSTWSGETTPILANASEYTDENGNFDEPGWRAAHASTGPWSGSITTSTVWMATAQKIKKNSNSATTIWSDWQITRCKGINGKAGNGRNVMCYCSLPEGYKPTRANLAGGKFYPNKWDMAYPTDPVGIIVEGVKKYCSWGDSNEPVNPTYKVWMTNADFPSSTGTSKDEFVEPIVKTDTQKQEYTWSTPVCITGEKGDNGADGDAIEFIYFRTADNNIIPVKPDGMSDPDYQKPDFTPEAYIYSGDNKEIIIDTGEKWKDHPLGIEKGFRCEWMSQRTKDSATGLWGAFSDVAPWSRWGEDGIDGDGVEYIFAITSEMTEQAKNSIIAKLPRSTDSALSGQWQNPEIWDYIRERGLESAYAPWTDDPKDVGPTKPYEWVCMRKRKWDETLEDSKFGEFGDPVLWGRWNETVFTSFAFAELLSGPDYDISDCTVTGGSFDNPIPTATKRGSQVLSYVHWTDGPTSTSAGTQIWMTKATFSNSGATGMILGDGWSKPELMADSDNFEVMYSPRDTDTFDTLPPNFKKIGVNIDSEWLDLAAQKGWYDEVSQIPDGQQAIYMATITGHNNVWDKDGDGNDDWQYIRVKGEKGDPGSSPSDLEYLRDIFGEKNVDQGSGAILREFLGVTEGADSGSTIVAFMNGSNGNDNAFIDSTHGKLMIAAGANGLENAHSAKFRVYADGSVFTENGYFKGEIEASSGNIGGISIGNNGLSSTNFSLSSDGKVIAKDIEINNENVTINNNGITFSVNNNPILTVLNETFNSVTDFTTVTGTPINQSQTTSVSAEYEEKTSWYAADNVNEVWQWKDHIAPEEYYTFTIDTKQNVTVKIYYTIVTEAKIDASGTYGQEPVIMVDCPNIDIRMTNMNSSDYYDLFNFTITNDTGGFTANTQTYFSAATQTKLLMPGTYKLGVYIEEACYNAYYESGAQFDKDVRFHIKQTVTFSKIELNGVIVDKYTGIFANGIGVKSDSDNYFFVNHTPDNGLTISAKSKGKGFTLSNGTWTWEGGINP